MIYSRLSVLCGLIFLFLGSSANAQVFQLTFEGLKNNEEVRDFYNAGTGSLGSSGPNYGVSFNNNALALIDSDATGGTGNIANEPSPNTVINWGAGASVVMNVPSGFNTGFSFYYSSSAPVTVTLYDGMNASGTILATINLTAQHNANGCSGDPNGAYCNWSQAGASFSGTVRSVDFSGGVVNTAYDNITFGNSTPTVPAPAQSIPTLSEWGILILTGLMSAVAFRAYQRRAYS